MTIRLVSYWPLCTTAQGRKAITDYNLLPYIDSSTRREPSFEVDYPGISATCRKGKLAPRLYEGDIVVYITRKNDYNKTKIRHWKLVAILDVIYRFENHQDAAQWYTMNGYDIPSNCVIGNNHIPYQQTGMGAVEATRAIQDYITRTNEFPVYLVCKPWYKELSNPPMITSADMHRIFGKDPGTQNPRYITKQQLQELMKLI